MQQADEMNLQPREEACERPFAVIQLHGSASAGRQMFWQRFVQRDVNAHTLRVAYPAIRGFRRRQLAVYRLLPRQDPGIAAGNMCAENAARERIKYHGGVGPLMRMT